MNSLTLILAVLVIFALGYRFYGGFLSKLYELDPSRDTPAHTRSDGVDFVPARNWWVLFGHHFSSICGAGPIVGPVLACAYWGWGVSLVWVVVGVVWMGAVSDFSALVISIRSKGESISNISGAEISPRARMAFAIFLWISLILVIAVFAIFAAKTFIQEPDAVVPSVGLIPTALLIGWLLYSKKMADVPATLIGLVILGVLLYLGTVFELRMPSAGAESSIAFFNAQNNWILLLLAYCFIASVVPVQKLLQPRDYMASFILFALIGIGVASVVVVHPVIRQPGYRGFTPADWPEAGPLWPMLFVTIACGAISGFHALVSSGTTCKQLSSEGHACRIGYGGMLVEALVAVLVIISVTAGLTHTELTGFLGKGGPIAAFGHGYGAISEWLLGGYGRSFAILALNAFILTTLDTATRITRYITAELFGIKNIYLAALIAVSASGLLALSGSWTLLWPAFGAANQLIAGITLLVASCWLLNRGRNFKVTLIPSLLMLVTTVAAFGWQIAGAVGRRSPAGDWNPDWAIAVIEAVLIVIAAVILAEAVQVFRGGRSKIATSTYGGGNSDV